MNLIVLCSDTYRIDHLTCYRPDSPVQTPNIDKLAEEGIRFDAAFGEGTPTLPARRVMYTGRPIFPFLWSPQKWDTVQLAGWHPMFHEDVTMAECLQEKGYTTGLISDLPHQFKPGKNFHRGFLQFEWVRGNEMDYLTAGPRAEVPAHKFQPSGEPSRVLVQFLMNNRNWRYESDWSSAVVIQKGIRFLKDNAAQQPFMLWLECFFPHEPWYSPPELVEKHYEGSDHDGIEWIFPPGSTQNLTENQVHRIRANYRGLCEMIDRWFGRLLETVDDLRLWDDTVIVFLSDHGTMLGEQGQIHKGANRLRWQCTQVPLLIRHPDTSKYGGKTVGAFVQHQDLMPTLLDMMGQDKPERSIGADLVPLIHGKVDSIRDHVVTAFGNYASVRTADWNFQTAWVKDNWEAMPQRHRRLAPPELYDLKADPEELSNVVNEHPEIAREYSEMLLEYIHQNKPLTRGSLHVGDSAFQEVPLFDQSRL